MTSPAGYRRVGGGDPPVASRLWQAMRAASAPWTVAELAAAAGASVNYAKHYVAALRRSRHVEIVEPARHRPEPGMSPATYRLVRDTGPRPPQRIGRDRRAATRERNSPVPGSALAAARAKLGWPKIRMARHLGYRDERAVTRLEAAETLPATVVAALSRLPGPDG